MALHTRSIDRFFSGIFFSLIVSVVIMVVIDALSGYGKPLHDLGLANFGPLLGVSATITAFIVFPRPLLWRTILKKHRDPFLLDTDLNNMLMGRAVGILFGLMAGAMIIMTWK